MRKSTVSSILQRVLEHCKQHNIHYFDFIFHGGEPLLLTPEFYVNFVNLANEYLNGLTLGFALQTNGVLINEEWCKTFEKLDISVGISIDGTKESHDFHRKYHHGKGSYEDVLKGLNFLKNHQLPYQVGILMLIDVFSDPKEVYRHLKNLKVKAINLLLPYGNFESLPPAFEGSNDLQTHYADWLIEIFDYWFFDNETDFKIKIFEQLMELILGIDNGFEYWGQKNNEYLVIETDGSIEAVGALKLIGNGFTKAGMNVQHNSFDEALNTNLATQYHLGHQKVCSICQKCTVFEVCGGSFFPTRYRKENGFDNPSIYCKDLFKLINHVQNRMLDDMPDTLKTTLALDKKIR